MPIVGAITDWIKENQTLVVAIAAVGAGLLAMGATTVAVGLTVSQFTTTIAFLSKTMKLLSAPGGIIGLAIVGLIALEEATLGIGRATMQLNDALREEVSLRKQLMSVEQRRQATALEELEGLSGGDKVARAKQLLDATTKNIEVLEAELPKLKNTRLQGQTKAQQQAIYQSAADRVTGLKGFATALNTIIQQGSTSTPNKQTFQERIDAEIAARGLQNAGSLPAGSVSSVRQGMRERRAATMEGVRDILEDILDESKTTATSTSQIAQNLVTI